MRYRSQGGVAEYDDHDSSAKETKQDARRLLAVLWSWCDEQYG